MATMVMIDFMILIFFLGLNYTRLGSRSVHSFLQTVRGAEWSVVNAGMGAGTLHVNVYFYRSEAGRKLGLVLS